MAATEVARASAELPPRGATRDLLTEPFTRADFTRAAELVHSVLAPTPQIAWPLLAERCGCEVWVKHENHLPTGAFKVRGGLWYMHELCASLPAPRGVVCATRGNHGQSVAFAAARQGLEAVVVVPQGNNPDKNRAMRAYGAELVEYGVDFNAALEHAMRLAVERGLHAMPSFSPLLVQGVGTYALELFTALPDLAAVYVPIGLGSGLAGVQAVRDALGLDTELIGVVASGADAYARSFEARQPVATAGIDTIADGLAVRVPHADALRYLLAGVDRIVRVDDRAIATALAAYYSDTHTLAEGAGAAPLAALLGERERMRGRQVAVILTGGNIDAATFTSALADAARAGVSA